MRIDLTAVEAPSIRLHPEALITFTHEWSLVLVRSLALGFRTVFTIAHGAIISIASTVVLVFVITTTVTMVTMTF